MISVFVPMISVNPEFPSLTASPTETDCGATSTTAVVSLPANIVAGNLLLVMLVTLNVCTPTFPAGWINLRTAANHAEHFWYKIADGTEGVTITVTLSTTTPTDAMAMQVFGANQSVPVEVSAAVNDGGGGSVSPDGPSFTPTFGQRSTLWLTAFACANSTAVNAYPTNYALANKSHLSGGTGVSCGCAARQLNAATEDPGAFTLASSQHWNCYTLAIPPR